MHVTHDQERFLIGMHIVIDATGPQVFRALRDYADMPRYNPDLRAVRVESTSEPDRVRLFTTVHTCVLFFCKTVHQQQVMTATANASGGILQADLVAQKGAFEGYGRWAVGPCPVNGAPARLPQRAPASQACMDIQIVLVPVFWVPPVIGPWLVRRKMEQEAQWTSRGLELIAQGAAAPGVANPDR